MTRLLLALILATSSPALADTPFTASTLSRAQSSAQAEDRLVVVFLFNNSNADCSFMERDTWNHPDVRGWIERFGVAARVDTQSGHGASLKSRFQVSGTPTVLAFRGESLVARHTGLMSAAALVAWLDGARSGQGGTSTSEESSSESHDLDFDQITVAALSAGTPEERALALLETWSLTVGGPQQEARRAPLATALVPLIKESFNANERVAIVRNAAWSRWKKHELLPDLIDWIWLNHLLEEEPATLRWLDEVPPPDCRSAGTAALTHGDNPLLDLLIRRDRWGQIGACLPDPDQVVKAYQSRWRSKLESGRLMTDQDLKAHRTRLAGLAAGLSASGDDRAARRIVRAILEEDEKAAEVIVRVAIDAQVPRGWHRRLLDPRKKSEEALSIELNKAIKTR